MRRSALAALAALAAAGLGLIPTLVCADMPAETRRSVPSIAACDRACLYGFADRYMAALIAKDPTRLPLTTGVRFSENMVMMPLGEGAWNTADAIGPHFEFADIPHGQVGWMGTIVERGVSAVYGMRMKIEDGRIAEVETMVSRRGVTFPYGDPDHFEIPAQVLEPVPPAKRRLPERMIAIADGYFNTLALNDGVLFTQFTPDCSRRENASWTASDPHPDPKASLSRYGMLTCERGFALGNYRWDDRTRERRYPLVDEEQGMVLTTVFIDHSGLLENYATTDGQTLQATQKSPNSLAIMELFKIQDGRIRHAEAAFFTAPYRLPNPWLPHAGWPDPQ